MFRILLVIVLITYALKRYVLENVKVFDADVTADIKVLKTNKTICKQVYISKAVTQ